MFWLIRVDTCCENAQHQERCITSIILKSTTTNLTRKGKLLKRTDQASIHFMYKSILLARSQRAHY